MAVTDARRIIKNAPCRVTFRIISTSTLQAITGGLTALAGTVSKDASAFAAVTNAPAEIGTTGYGTLDLTAAEMAFDTIVPRVTASNANAVAWDQVLIPEAACDSGVAQGGTATSITLAATAPAQTTQLVQLQVEIVRGTGAGQVRTLTGYNGSTKVAAVDLAWQTNPDTTSVYVVRPARAGIYGTDAYQQSNAVKINSDATAAANLALLYHGGLTGDSINDVGPSATIFKANLLLTTDQQYTNQILVMTSGTYKGCADKISNYVGATRQITLATGLPGVPANGDTFVILGIIK